MNSFIKVFLSSALLVLPIIGSLAAENNIPPPPNNLSPNIYNSPGINPGLSSPTSTLNPTVPSITPNYSSPSTLSPSFYAIPSPAYSGSLSPGATNYYHSSYNQMSPNDSYNSTRINPYNTQNSMYGPNYGLPSSYNGPGGANR